MGSDSYHTFCCFPTSPHLQTLGVVRVCRLARPRGAASGTSPAGSTTLTVQSRTRSGGASRRRRRRRGRCRGRCTSQFALDKGESRLAVFGTVALVRGQRVAIATVLIGSVAVGLDLGRGGAYEAGRSCIKLCWISVSS